MAGTAIYPSKEQAFRLQVCILPACGAAACLLAAVAASAWPGLALPFRKLFSLAAQYGMLLPCILCAARAARRTNPVSAALPSGYGLRAILAASALFLIPFAFLLQPGVFSGDESTYLFQARCISAGGLSTAAPPLPESDVHFTHHLVRNGRWFGKYPFAWPVLLSMASLVRLEWLLNPLFGLVLLWIAYRIGRLAGWESEARYGVLFLAASPFFTLNCLGYFSHGTCGVFVAAATWFHFRAVKSARVAWIAAMVGCLGAATLVRPFTGACASLVLGVSTVLCLRRDGKVLGRAAAAAVPMLLLTVAVHAATSRALIGSYTRSVYAAYHGLDSPSELSIAPRVLAQGLFSMAPRRLIDTAAATFPFLFLLAAYGFWRRRRQPAARVLAGLFAVLVLGHVLQIEDSDTPIGERHYWEAFFAAALLAGMGYRDLLTRVRPSPALRRAAVAGVAIAAAALWLFYVPLQWTSRYPYRAIAKAAAEPR